MEKFNFVSINYKMKTFTHLVALVWLACSNLAYAVDTADTLPVYGRGAPTAPTNVSVFGFVINKAVIAPTYTDSSDPDGDPITYEVRWCTGTNGSGTCVTGTTPTFTNNSTRYVSVRAITPRGFPAASQGQGSYSADAISVNGDLINLGGVGTFMKPLDGTGRTWSVANQLCLDLVKGGYSDWRLPTEDEMKALYNYLGYGRANPDMGWPTGTIFYHTSSEAIPVTAGWHRYVGLLDGASGNSSDGTGRLVTCIRV